jgi:Rrf2 family protein
LRPSCGGQALREKFFASLQLVTPARHRYFASGYRLDRFPTFAIPYLLMKVSKRGEYALRALIDLGMAHGSGRELLQVREIAAYENIPIKFLEQIFMQLKQAGLVKTRRGKKGGYALAKPADAVAIGQVVRLIDGPLAPIGCVSQTAYEKCSCPDEAHCGLRLIMLDVRNAIAGILDSFTLSQIIEVSVRKMKRDGLPLPFTPRSGPEISPGDYMI